MLRRSLPSDPRWTPAPHVRSLRSHSTPAQVAEALRAACEVPHPAVQVDAAVYTDAADVPALYADLDYGALLVLVVDVERLALGARRRPSADTLLVSDLAGWDWVVLLGPEDQLLASSLHIDARLAGRISCVVRTEHVVRQLVTQLQCLAFRAPIGFGPNAPWLPAGYAALEALPARTVLALRRLRAQREDASVKQLAFLAGISRRQLERQFEMTGLGSPADFVAMMVATDH
jgi:AraC-like DNA-binding protein